MYICMWPSWAVACAMPAASHAQGSIATAQLDKRASAVSSVPAKHSRRTCMVFRGT